MRIITSLQEMQSLALEQKNLKRSLGFVPTMGALHAGHLSLVQQAKVDNDLTVVSIFVNPKQFGPKEDYHTYPRSFNTDCQLLEQVQVDILFYPNVEEFYPPLFQTQVIETELQKPLCGISRPNHFQGVCTVVLKLFHLVQPNKAYFGLKDYQQFRILSQMVTDLSLPISMIGCPIVREKDGLAMSSRNRYLSPQERSIAPLFYQSLRFGKSMIEAEQVDAIQIQAAIKEQLRHPMIQIDYLEVVHPNTLLNMDSITKPVLLIGAIFLGKTRLIDNIVIENGMER